MNTGITLHGGKTWKVRFGNLLFHFPARVPTFRKIDNRFLELGFPSDLF